VPQSAARRGGERLLCPAPPLAEIADHAAVAQARIRRVRSVSAFGVGASGRLLEAASMPSLGWVLGGSLESMDALLDFLARHLMGLGIGVF
jgi:hypothetical protein